MLKDLFITATNKAFPSGTKRRVYSLLFLALIIHPIKAHRLIKQQRFKNLYHKGKNINWFDLERKIRLVFFSNIPNNGLLYYFYKAKAELKTHGVRTLFKKITNKMKWKMVQRNSNYFVANNRTVFKADNINKYDVIFFSIINWDFRFQRPQHIASKFIKHGHRVFYISINLVKRDSYICRKIAKNIYEIILPFNVDTDIYHINLKEKIDLLQTNSDKLFENFNIKESIAFIEFPLWYPLVKYLKNEFGTKIIFDCLDEYSGFENVHVDVHLVEKKLVKIADYCIATSIRLYESHKKECKNIALIRNATEFENFNKAPSNSVLKHIKKPIIGYYGAISHWFDVDMVTYIAKNKPDWNIVLIGDTHGANVKPLEKYSNIYILGEKFYKELPKYLYWFDVCIIPFKLIDLILSTNPVKFYEFMSAGKPVVSVELPELVPYSDLLYLAEGKKEFVQKIGKALQENNPALYKKRIEFAKENDWDHRFVEINDIIKATYSLVSIVVITYNNLHYTKLCIESIYGKTAYPNFELIIVDNASKDETAEYLTEIKSKHENIKIILNKKNAGFAAGNNIGIKQAKGNYIILLNNDTIVTRGWISGLLKHLQDPKIGMVGPVTSFAGNEARIKISYKSSAGIEKFAEKYTRTHKSEIFDIGVLAMFCVALSRKTLNKVGLLDEQFGVGMFEDDDYAYRIQQAGLRTVCTEDVFIHHFGRVSFSKIEQERYNKLFNENKQKFEQKWGIKWQPHKARD